MVRGFKIKKLFILKIKIYMPNLFTNLDAGYVRVPEEGDGEGIGQRVKRKAGGFLSGLNESPTGDMAGRQVERQGPGLGARMKNVASGLDRGYVVVDENGVPVRSQLSGRIGGALRGFDEAPAGREETGEREPTVAQLVGSHVRQTVKIGAAKAGIEIFNNLWDLDNPPPVAERDPDQGPSLGSKVIKGAGKLAWKGARAAGKGLAGAIGRGIEKKRQRRMVQTGDQNSQPLLDSGDVIDAEVRQV